MLKSQGLSVTVAVRSVLAASAMAMTIAAAQAQQTGDETRLEEITVTAQRGATETNLQTTPISVSAVTSADIDRLVAKDISGLASSVPGFSAARITAFNAASFAMRGVGLTDIIVYQDSPVGVQVDAAQDGEGVESLPYAGHIEEWGRCHPTTDLRLRSVRRCTQSAKRVMGMVSAMKMQAATTSGV